MRLVIALIAFLLSSAVYAADSCQAIFGGGHVTTVAQGHRTQVFLPSGEFFFMIVAEGKPALHKPALDQRMRDLGAIEIPDHADPDMNCHGYACFVSGIPGLPAGWIEGRPSQKILRNFFRPLDLAHESATNGDLVVFHRGVEVTHTGVIETDGPSADLRVRSKFGEDRTWILPLDAVARFYESDRIEFWRKN